MDQKETILLHWSDFQSNAVNSFQDVRLSLKYSDVTLACKDNTTLFQAHKVILASGSSWFQRVLDQLPGDHALLFLSGVGRRELEAVLDFLYTGQARLPQGDLQHFLQAAQALEVRGLQKAGEEDDTDVNEPLEESDIVKHEIVLANGDDMGKTNFTLNPSIKQASQKTSMAWNYFEKIRNVKDVYTSVKCILCGFTLVWKNSTTNMLTHIKSKHRLATENWTDEKLMVKKKLNDFSEIEDQKKFQQNLLIKHHEENLAISKESETDKQSPEFVGTSYDSINDISFDRKVTTYNLWELDETMKSEDAWEMSNDEKEEAVKMALSNRSPIWEFMEKTNDGLVQCILCGKLLRSTKSTTSALIEHMLRNHKESKESAKLKWNILMKAHTRTSRRMEQKQKEESSLMKDMMMDVAEDKLQCKVCGKFKSSKSEMIQHIKKHM